MEQTFSRAVSSLHHNDLVSEQIGAQEVRIGARNIPRSLHDCKSTQTRTVLSAQPKYFGSRIVDCAREISNSCVFRSTSNTNVSWAVAWRGEYYSLVKVDRRDGDGGAML
jgi:hypothetical protein